MIYGVSVTLADEIVQVTNETIKSQLDKIATTLNKQYNTNYQVKVLNNKHIIYAGNSSYICDYVYQSNIYSKESNIRIIISILLLDTVDFIQKSEESDIRDTIDFLSKYVEIKSELSNSNYIIFDINYCQKTENVLYQITLKVDQLNRLDIRLVYIYDEDDLIDSDLPQILSILDNAYINIINTIASVTNDEE